LSRFKVTEHIMVPEHRIMKEPEVKKLLARYKITRDQLPKIKMSDPCIRAMIASGKDIEPGMIVEIKRQSPTAGVSIGYRVIVEG